MQQGLLMTAIRGADNAPKGHVSKQMVKFFRRCILVTSFGYKALNDPCTFFEGPFMAQSVPSERSEDWVECMNEIVQEYLGASDEMPFHFQMHFFHAAEVVGYKHPIPRVRRFWNNFYLKAVKAMHLNPETEERMNFRLGDVEKQWAECQVI